MMGIQSEVVLIAEATALPGKRDELRRAFDELVQKSLAEEGRFRLPTPRESRQAGPLRPLRAIPRSRLPSTRTSPWTISRRSCAISLRWRRGASQRSPITTP